MKQYSDPEPDLELLANYESFFQTPKTVRHSLELGEAHAKRIDHKLSSPTRKRMESYREGCEQILRVADIQQGNLITIQTAMKEAIRRKATNRIYIVGKGPITAQAAIQAVTEKKLESVLRRSFWFRLAVMMILTLIMNMRLFIQSWWVRTM